MNQTMKRICDPSYFVHNIWGADICCRTIIYSYAKSLTKVNSWIIDRFLSLLLIYESCEKTYTRFPMTIPWILLYLTYICITLICMRNIVFERNHYMEFNMVRATFRLSTGFITHREQILIFAPRIAKKCIFIPS